MATNTMIRLIAKDGSWFKLYDDQTKYVTRPDARKAVMDLFKIGNFPPSLLPLLTDTERE